jgi:hypothetical protein
MELIPTLLFQREGIINCYDYKATYCQIIFIKRFNDNKSLSF